MNKSNVVIIIVLIAILVPAILSTLKHMRGEGSCCGGPKEKVKKKKISGNILRSLEYEIGGMMCQSCANRIQNRLNEIDGVACKCVLSDRKAKLDIYKHIENEEIDKAIISLGYKILNVKEKDPK